MTTLYPGWTVRIYTNVSSGNPYACQLICKYDMLFWCDITDIPGMGNFKNKNNNITEHSWAT